MADREKLKKAAIMAVMAFLEEEEKSKKSVNNWTRSGREMIMKNRHMAQTKLFR